MMNKTLISAPALASSRLLSRSGQSTFQRASLSVGFVQSTAWKRNNQPKILVTGAAGQIGLEIVP
jgi:hypothetical protein